MVAVARRSGFHELGLSDPDAAMAEVARALRALDVAASHEHGLVDAFPAVADALGAERMYLFRISQAGQLEFVCNDEAAGLLADYAANDWAARDDWTQTCLSLRCPNTLLTDAALIAPEQRRRSPFFQDFAQKWGCGRVAAWAFRWAGERWGFTVSRSDRAGAFDGGECAALTQIMADANRAVIAAGALVDARRYGFAEGLSRAGRAVILLDQDGRVGFVSPGAERLFGDHFGVRDGRLFASDAPAQAELDRLAARAKDSRPWACRKAMFCIPRARARRPILASASPLRLSALDILPGARVLLVLTDVGQAGGPSIEALRAAFGVSPRQAEIAQALARGETIESFAADHKIQVSTVRHHVKALMTRTDTHRLAALVALIKDLPGE
jgi:DNA-binding CsgD family transcriptional regulator/PAS domain-containing protein